MKNTKNTTQAVLVYPSPCDNHVAALQGLILAGHGKKDILDAYVTARFPEVEAGTLLRINHGAAPRPLDDPKAVSKAKADLRKHGNTHFKMAEADMSPATVAARQARTAESVAKAEANLARAKERAAATPVAPVAAA